MPGCLVAPSHILNQCLLISKGQWHALQEVHLPPINKINFKLPIMNLIHIFQSPVKVIWFVYQNKSPNNSLMTMPYDCRNFPNYVFCLRWVSMQDNYLGLFNWNSWTEEISQMNNSIIFCKMWKLIYDQKTHDNIRNCYIFHYIFMPTSLMKSSLENQHAVIQYSMILCAIFLWEWLEKNTLMFFFRLSRPTNLWQMTYCLTLFWAQWYLLLVYDIYDTVRSWHQNPLIWCRIFPQYASNIMSTLTHAQMPGIHEQLFKVVLYFSIFIASFMNI